MQLTELRDFVGDRLSGHYTPSAVDHHELAPAAHEPVEPVVEEVASGPSAWDRMKLQMLGTEPGSESSANEPEPVAFNEPIPEAPAPVEWATVTSEGLKAALETRDDFIAYALRRLRAAEAHRLPTDWSAVSAVDADGAAALENLAKQLEEKLRLCEIEFSLERAKLAREQGRLHQQQELVEKQLKRLGLDRVEQAAAIPQDAGTHQDRRWTRFLGVNRGGQ
jgi:hypothetical protein